MKKLLFFLLVLILPMFLIISCSKNSSKKTETNQTISDASGMAFDPSDPSATVSVTVTVTDSDEKAISGVKLLCMGSEYTLDTDATDYTLTGISVQQAPTLVVKADGYMPKILNVNPMDCTNGISVVLLALETSATVDGTSGGTVEAKSGSVTFSAGAFSSGSVTVGLRVSDVNRDYTDDNGKPTVELQSLIKVGGSSSKLAGFDRATKSSGSTKMYLQLATVSIQASETLASGASIEFSAKISDSFTDTLDLSAGDELPLIALNETSGEWEEITTCTLANDNGSLVAGGNVTATGTFAVAYETCYACIKAEIEFSIPKTKTVVSRQYSLAEGYDLHTYMEDGKLGVVALVPTDSDGKVLGSFNLLSEYNLQTTSEMTDPVDSFAGNFIKQTDEIPVQTTSALLTGTEFSSLAATLAVCSMAATKLTVTVPDFGDITDVDMSDAEEVDPADVQEDEPLIEELVGEWASPCQNYDPGTENDSKYVLTVNNYNEMVLKSKTYSSTDESCSGDLVMLYKNKGTLTAASLYDPMNNIYKITSTLESDTVTLYTADAVEYYNTNSIYGISNWAIGVEQDVTSEAGTASYDLLQIVDDKLWFGYAGDDDYYDGSTDEKRPVDIDDSYSLDRQ